MTHARELTPGDLTQQPWYGVGLLVASSERLAPYQHGSLFMIRRKFAREQMVQLRELAIETSGFTRVATHEGKQG